MKRREMAERIERLEATVADLTLRTRRERPARPLHLPDVVGRLDHDIRELDRRIMRRRSQRTRDHGSP